MIRAIWHFIYWYPWRSEADLIRWRDRYWWLDGTWRRDYWGRWNYYSR